MLKLDQLIALAAGFTVMLVQGSLYVYGTLSPYIVTYLHYHSDPTITISQLSFILTLTIITTNLGLFFANFSIFQLGNKMVALLSMVGISASVFVLAFMDSFVGYILMYGVVYGIFIGFGYMAPIKNCYEHLPGRKGLCSGICLMGFGIGALIFNFIIVELVNPNNEKQENHLFPESVGDNLPFCFQIMSAVYLVIGIIGVLLISPPKVIKNPLLEDENSIVEARSIQNVKTTEQSCLEDEKFYSPKIFKHLLQKRLHFVLIILSLSVPYGMFVAFNYKQFGLTKISNDKLLSLMGSLGSLMNGTSRVVWGTLMDKFSYKVIGIFICSLLLVSSILIRWAIQSQALYFMLVILTYGAYGGLFSVYPTQTIRMLGKKMGSKMYYAVFTGFSFGCIIQFLLHLLLVEGLGAEDGYNYCFISFGVMLIIAIAMLYFIEFEINLQEKQLLESNKRSNNGPQSASLQRLG